MGGAFEVGATYLPAATGPYMWHEPSPARWAADVAALCDAGLRTVRVHLAWDAFMPTHRQVSRRRIGDLEDLIDAVRDAGGRVVPVLFAQSFGDCVLLPSYAVDRRVTRRGVRVVSDTNVGRGGPRDLYTDALMVELAETWLTTLLDAFGGHPAVAGWDLGHDPATTVRPRRIADMAGWVGLLAGLVRGRGERALLTLGAADVLTGRGVRLAAVTPHLDGLGLALPATPAPPETGGTVDADPDFVLALAQRLAAPEGGDGVPVTVVTGLPSFAGAPEAPPPVAVRRTAPAAPPTAPTWDVEPLPGDAARSRTDAVLARLRDAGADGVTATAWSDLGPRLAGVPPYDRRSSLLRHGLVSTGGDAKPAADAWTALARREPATVAPQPWPDRLDVDDYYAGLPDSARDLHARWRGDRQGTA